jgi:uncharacterized protein (DUF885 family)
VAGLATRRARLSQVLTTALAIDESTLPQADRITRSVLIGELESGLAWLDCGQEAWAVDPLEGPPAHLFDIPSYQAVRTPGEGRAMVGRWRQIPDYLARHVANLERGLGDGRVAARDPVRRVVDQLESILARPAEEWPLADPGREERPDWSSADSQRFREELEAAVVAEVRPAFERYHRFLRDRLLPETRPQDRAGIMHMPDGRETYRRLIRVHTSLPLSADELHATGLRELERIDGEMAELGAAVLGTANRQETLARLRTDPALKFATRDEVFAKAESALARARERIPGWFGRLPAAGCQVVRMPEHEEKHSTIAYYRQPADDGSRPGRYFINTSEPATRPRYEAEVLAYHEAIPGHHLQVAIAQELEGLPAFRRHLGVTAFWEGWALYTERLSDEMGLYSGELDRIGVLSFDAWRACRLVVDTGMHALGWSRLDAIDLMLEHTALGENNIANEVDRYLVWPAQALAYKTGQLEILRLRALAESRLGDRFDVRAFHDAVLTNGAVGLGTLRAIVERWVEGSPVPAGTA